MRRCAALGVSHLHDRLLFNGFQHMRRQCIFRGTHKDPDKKTALDMSQYYDGYSKTDFTILLVDTMCLPGYTLLYTSIGDPGRQNTRVVIAIVFTCTFYRQGAHLRGDDLWCWSASRLNGRQGRSIAPTGPFSGEQE